MSKYEHKPGRGSAFPNEKKVEDWHATHRGKLMLPDGTLHWVDVWVKPWQNTDKVELRIGNPVKVGEPTYSGVKAAPGVINDEEIPF